MLRMASTCGSATKYSCPARQMTVKYVYYPLKKRDFLKVKSHYLRNGSTPMIALISCHRGYCIPVEKGMCLDGA